MKRFKTIGITCKSNLDSHEVILKEIITCLIKQKFRIFLDHRVQTKTQKVFDIPLFKENTKVDLILTFGGDGTMLRAIQEHFPKCTYFLGINMGHLGFLSEIPPDNFENAFRQIMQNKYTIDERHLIKIKIKQKKTTYRELLAINEIVIHQNTDVTRIVNLKTEVDRKKLTTYHADGLIVATPTGSTAYSLSAGGPILHPRVPAFIITPINPHSFAQKPIVIPDYKKIYIYADSSLKPLSITIDGQKRYDLGKRDVIKIRKHPQKVHFIRLQEEGYYRTIRCKLKWGERVIN